MSRWLDTPPVGWTESTDVVIVGSGVAGLSVALRLRRAGLDVVIVTKQSRGTGSTRWAQGGVAAALGPGDDPEAHFDDTLAAGGGLCDVAAVRVLVSEGPARLRELIDLGATFDTDERGALQLTREGGHHRRRVAHAGGDATGAEVQRALEDAVGRDPGIRLVEHALALDLLTDETGQAAGVTVHVLGEGMPDGVGAVTARAVVLATGGLGQIYSATTNPEVSTGDGLALALRAGAVVSDLEFVQFHPTALWDGSGGRLPLVTEALRGEGAVLLDSDGKRFMAGVHPLEDLAPRDVVARAMSLRLAATSGDHLYLDATGLGRDFLAARFPTAVGLCQDIGVDIAAEPVPVVPAAHYASGGVRTDLLGRTSVPGLYACGEVACTGVHGANRLASNSLLEGLVFGARIGEELGRALPAPGGPVIAGRQDTHLVGTEGRAAMREVMSRHVGVLRSAAGLAEAATVLSGLASSAAAVRTAASWETANMWLVASALAYVAALRTESRGCHWREDHQSADDAWLGSILVARRGDGALRADFLPSEDGTRDRHPVGTSTVPGW